MIPADLIGAWDLVSFVVTFDDGRSPVHPFGEAGVGRIVYSADGAMLAVLSRADRAPLDVPRLEAAALADVTEKAAAFDSYLSYGGTWHLDGDTVVHHVELALLPNIVGLDQRRAAHLDDDTLTLSYVVTPRSGPARTYTLTWTRHGGAR